MVFLRSLFFEEMGWGRTNYCNGQLDATTNWTWDLETAKNRILILHKYPISAMPDATLGS